MNTTETMPRQFAHTTDMATMREVRNTSRETFDQMAEMAENLTPADAVRFAQRLLVQVKADGFSYADFQSAQAVSKYVGRAVSALRGLSL